MEGERCRLLLGDNNKDGAASARCPSKSKRCPAGVVVDCCCVLVVAVTFEVERLRALSHSKHVQLKTIKGKKGALVSACTTSSPH